MIIIHFCKNSDVIDNLAIKIRKSLNIKEIEYLCTVKIKYYLSPEEVFKYLLFCTLKYKISTVSNTN